MCGVDVYMLVSASCVCIWLVWYAMCMMCEYVCKGVPCLFKPVCICPHYVMLCTYHITRADNLNCSDGLKKKVACLNRTGSVRRTVDIRSLFYPCSINASRTRKRLERKIVEHVRTSSAHLSYFMITNFFKFPLILLHLTKIRESP